jgi:uncharacterized membrane protein
VTIGGGRGDLEAPSRQYGLSSSGAQQGGTAAVNAVNENRTRNHGWLILLVIGQVLGIFRVLKSIFDDIDLYKEVNPSAVVAVHAELGLNVAFLILVIVTAVAMFRRLRSFPTLWIYQGIAAILVPILDGALASALLNVPLYSVIDAQVGAQIVATAIAVVLWTWYLRVSVRVRNTFVN